MTALLSSAHSSIHDGPATQTLSSLKHHPWRSDNNVTRLPCADNFGSLPLHTDPEMYALRNSWSSTQCAAVSAVTTAVPPTPITPVSAKRTESPSSRLAYVEALVDTNALVIESIWGSAPPAYPGAVVVSLRMFIQEVLKRSRTTYSTLQTALFYLFRARPAIVERLRSRHPAVTDFVRPCTASAKDQDRYDGAYISCGRRMFLASLVVASKFVQDKTYRNSAWAKIAGLSVAEINAAERVFLELIDYQLFIAQPTFDQWHHLLHMHVEAKTKNQPTTLHDLSRLSFAAHSTTPHRAGWAVVLSPSLFLGLPSPMEVQTPTTPSRKRRFDLMDDRRSKTGSFVVLSPPLSCSPGSIRSTSNASSPPNADALPGPPMLPLSLPSTISSSPLPTPSPVRVHHGSSFLWKLTSPTHMDHYHALSRAILPEPSPKKFKFQEGYAISHIRQRKPPFPPPPSSRR